MLRSAFALLATKLTFAPGIRKAWSSIMQIGEPLSSYSGCVELGITPRLDALLQGSLRRASEVMFAMKPKLPLEGLVTVDRTQVVPSSVAVRFVAFTSETS